MVDRALTGVSASFTATHTDPHLGEGTHEHTWTVTAWFPSEPFRDGRALRAGLVTMLSAWDGGHLPPELWSGEALAAAIMHLLVNCVGVDVSRPEGFHAKVRA